MKWYKIVFWIIILAFLLWILASFIDIVADNSLPNPHHYRWNLFVQLFNK